MKILKQLLYPGLIALLGFLPFKEVKSCDVCALFSGATPNILKNRAGVYFRYRSFSGLYNGTSYQKTSHFPDGFPIPTPGSPVQVTEQYASSTFYGRWFFKPRWNVQMQLPLVYNSASIGDYSKSIGGLGDANVMVNAAVVDQADESQSLQVFLGAGIKLPTGAKFSEITDYLEWYELQGTTGSIDALFRADVSWRSNKFGLISSNLFRLNTADKHEMRFGNFLNMTANAFYLVDLADAKFQLMPAAGAFLESYSGRTLYGEQISDTGGSTLFATASVSLFLNSVAIRTEIQIPVWQDLNGIQMLSNPAGVVDISYNF